MMQERMGTLAMWVVLMLAGPGLLGGCQTARMDIAVGVDEQAFEGAIPSLEVDLFVVREQERDLYYNYSVDRWTRAGDSLRRDTSPHTLTFTDSDRQTKYVRANDPVWEDWLGSDHQADTRELFVIVNLPGISSDEPGGRDPRRLILPLGPKVWEEDELRLLVQPSRITTRSSRRAERDWPW